MLREDFLWFDLQNWAAPDKMILKCWNTDADDGTQEQKSFTAAGMINCNISKFYFVKSKPSAAHAASSGI